MRNALPLLLFFIDTDSVRSAVIAVLCGAFGIFRTIFGLFGYLLCQMYHHQMGANANGLLVMQLMSLLTTVNQMFGHFSSTFLSRVARNVRACRIRSGVWGQNERHRWMFSAIGCERLLRTKKLHCNCERSALSSVGMRMTILGPQPLFVKLLFAYWRCTRCFPKNLQKKIGEKENN